jgi:hypothetical protein
MISNMAAQQLIRRRVVMAENAFAELVLWRLDGPVPPCGHPYKYRLALIREGRCIVRYDNERGKGDHRHWGDSESPYTFTDVDRLVADFFNDVTRWLNEHGNP